MRNKIANVVLGIAALGLLVLACGVPYILYVAHYSPQGMLDDRLSWVPFGIPGSFGCIALARISGFIHK